MNRTPDNTEIRVAGYGWDRERGDWEDAPLVEWRTCFTGVELDGYADLLRSDLLQLRIPRPVVLWTEWEECPLSLAELRQLGFPI